MASLKCGFCGYGIHYHGEPEIAADVEHYFCQLSRWREFENKNYNLSEHWKEFIESWRCERCGSFSFFADDSVSGIYLPKENSSKENMKEPFEFGPFWGDHLWFDITEADTPASEVLKKFPNNMWLAKNNEEMRIYEDEAQTKCINQFKRICVAEKITVQGMTLSAFKKILLTWDDIEFSYRGVHYNFMKESLTGKKNQIEVWRGYSQNDLCYSVTIQENENFVDGTILLK